MTTAAGTLSSNGTSTVTTSFGDFNYTYQWLELDLSPFGSSPYNVGAACEYNSIYVTPGPIPGQRKSKSAALEQLGNRAVDRTLRLYDVPSSPPSPFGLYKKLTSWSWMLVSGAPEWTVDIDAIDITYRQGAVVNFLNESYSIIGAVALDSTSIAALAYYQDATTPSPTHIKWGDSYILRGVWDPDKWQVQPSPAETTYGRGFGFDSDRKNVRQFIVAGDESVPVYGNVTTYFRDAASTISILDTIHPINFACARMFAWSAPHSALTVTLDIRITYAMADGTTATITSDNGPQTLALVHQTSAGGYVNQQWNELTPMQWTFTTPADARWITLIERVWTYSENTWAGGDGIEFFQMDTDYSRSYASRYQMGGDFVPGLLAIP